MRIGIYNESTGGALGGSEYMLASLAEALSSSHAVDLIHHHRDLTRERLELFSGLNLRNVGLRHVERVTFQPSASQAPWRIWRDSTSWQNHLSQPYDAFVIAAHSLPPFCQARRGVLIILFPLFRPWLRWPFTDEPKGPWDFKRRTRNLYYGWEWRRRLSSYSRILSISDFTRTWTQEYWHVDSTVVYPPVATATNASTGPKKPEILSVGRFTPHAHSKKYPELIRALGELTEVVSGAWSYHCAGSLGDSADDQEYFRAVSDFAKGRGTFLHPNLPRPELVARYDSAQIFVHGAGLDEPASKPELTEHFGISTVEAMAAGCVPVVINRGAQPEIVAHGESGFVWNTIPELKSHVGMLMKDADLRDRMSAAARVRAERFTRQRFLSEMVPVVTAAAPVGAA